MSDHRIRSTTAVRPNRKRLPGELIKDVCWLCEGWREVDLTWNLLKSGFDHKPPAFLYLDYLGFNGLYLGL